MQNDHELCRHLMALGVGEVLVMRFLELGGFENGMRWDEMGWDGMGWSEMK